MSVETRCPSCARVNPVEPAQAGKPLRCPECGTRYTAAVTVGGAGASATRSGPAPKPVPVAGAAAIGRFQVRARLGAGAFGTVYRAYDPQLDREVALKVPNAAALDNPRRVERFLREAKAAARLRHPHIVPVFDAGKDGDTYYIAAAFIDGKPLADAVEDRGMDFRRAAQLARELAEALAYAHGQGVVHRDVKPANILLDAQDRVQLADFGLAARQEEARLTNDGALLGTPAYMAPEAAAGQKGEAKPASDQYAAGVVLYELLTGRTPFEGPPEMVLYNAIHATPDSPRKHRPYTPKDLETICLKAMAKRPEDRYADCQALADDLRRWLEGQPVAARRLGPAERLVRWVRANPAVAGLSAAVLLALVGGSVAASVLAARAADRAREAEAARAKADETAQANEKLLRESLGLKDEVQLTRTQTASLTAGRKAEVDGLKKQVADLRGQLKAAEDKTKAAEEAATQAGAAAQQAKDEARVAGERAKQKLEAVGLQRPVTYATLLNRLSADTSLPAERAAALDPVPEGLRKWEWHYLLAPAQRPSSPFADGALAKGKYASARIAPDGNAVLAILPDSSLLDVFPLDENGPLAKGSHDIRFGYPAASLLPRGDGKDGLILVRDATENNVWKYTIGVNGGRTALVKKLRDDQDARTAWAVSANGDYFAFTSQKAKNVFSHGKVADLSFVVPWKESVIPAPLQAVSDGGEYWVAGNLLYDLRQNKPGTELSPTPLTFTGFAFSPKTTWLACAFVEAKGPAGVALLAPNQPAGPRATFAGHKKAVRAVAFSPDETRMATAGEDTVVKVWDTDTQECLLTLPAPGPRVEQLVFSQDGLRLVALTEDFRYRVWAAKKGPPGPKAVPKEKADVARLVGKWSWKDPPPDTSATMEFADGGQVTMTVVSNGQNIEFAGTYQLAGNKLTTKLKSKDVVLPDSTVTVIELTATTLVTQDDRGMKTTMVRSK